MNFILDGYSLCERMYPFISQRGKGAELVCVTLEYFVQKATLAAAAAAIASFVVEIFIKIA